MPYNLSYISKDKYSALAERTNKSYALQNKLSYTILEKAYIAPSNFYNETWYSGGIVSSDGKFQQSSAWHEGCPSGYLFDPKGAKYRNERVIYIGCLYHIWGHAITDNFKKIWYLNRNNFQKHKLVYITLENKPLPNYVYELFSLAGVNLHEAEHITQITKFKEVINPDNSIININEERYYSKEFAKIISKIKINIPTKDIGKVYFTRTHLLDNRDFGEKEIENIFQRRGYKIIAPEEYSVKEQLTILANCTDFVATEGSISHSSVFCKPSINIVLLRKVDFINPYSCFINQMFSFNVTYIDIHHSTLSPKKYPWRGPFYLYITNELSKYMGYYGLHIPYYLKFSWYEYRYNIKERVLNIFYKTRARIGLRTRLNYMFKAK